MVRWQGWLGVALTTFVLLAPTRGASPRITLHLESVTCEEAALALSRASGTPVELVPGLDPAALDREPALETELRRPARFHWQEVTFAEALRELCSRYQLRSFARLGGGFRLVQQPGAGPLPRFGPLGRTELRGMQIQVRSLTVGGHQPGQAPGEQMLLQLQGTAPAGDVSAILYLEDLLAQDDQGGLLSWRTGDVAAVQDNYPDEWSAQVYLSGLQPGARRLKWLEGVVVAAPVQRTLRSEISLPLSNPVTPQRLGSYIVAYLEYREAYPMLFAHPQDRYNGGPTLQIQVSRPTPEDPGKPSSQAVPLLVGASGRTYSPHSTNFSGTNGEDVQTSHVSARYPWIPEPVVQARMDLVERRASRPIGTFRIRDLPLPTPTAATAGGLAPDAVLADPLTGDSPDYADVGGTLVSPVQVGGQPAPPGKLFFGLSAADGSSRTRWYAAAVEAQGTAVLPHVRPGTYRVLRLYRGRTTSSLPVRGWWRNDESVIRVEAGKPVSLPPLALSATLPVPALSRLPRRLEDLEATAEATKLSYTRTLELRQPPVTSAEGLLSLELSGIVGGVAARQLFGVGNVVARDERGTLLTLRHRSRMATESAKDFQGLKWSQEIRLSLPHPQSKTLAWLEGDVLAYGRQVTVNAGVPLPLPPEGVRQEMDGLRIEVDSLEELRSEAPLGQPLPPIQYRLRGRVVGPNGTQLQTPDGGTWQPFLLGRSGNTYDPVFKLDTVEGGRRELHCRYETKEPVVKIGFQFVARTDLQPIASFRLTQVKLPEERPFQPPKAPQPRVRRITRSIVGEVRLPAFQHDDGSDLILPVRLGTQPAQDGSLLLGVSAQTRDGWGAVRWVEVEVLDGEVRLRDLKPGTYRIRRTYQALPPAIQPVGGSWSGTEVQVPVAAGKPSTAPPLVWSKKP